MHQYEYWQAAIYQSVTLVTHQGHQGDALARPGSVIPPLPHLRGGPRTLEKRGSRHPIEALRQRVRAKLDKFVDRNVADYIQMYKSIVIEFFLWLKIQLIVTNFFSNNF